MTTDPKAFLGPCTCFAFGPLLVISLRPSTRAQSESMSRLVSDTASDYIGLGHAAHFTSHIRWSSQISGLSSRLCPIGGENLPLLLHKAIHHTELTHERIRRGGTCENSTFAPYRNESAVMFNWMWYVRNNLFVMSSSPSSTT